MATLLVVACQMPGAAKGQLPNYFAVWLRLRPDRPAFCMCMHCIVYAHIPNS
jgi:hypothetical protein